MLPNSITLLTNKKFENFAKIVSGMFLKPIKNFCSLNLQLISFNQDILCLNTTKMKNFSLYVCLPCRPVVLKWE